MLNVTPPGYLDADSPLSDTTTVSDARRFDAARGSHVTDGHGLSTLERRAALTLASAARDASELRDLLAMCGLLHAAAVSSPPSTAGS